MSSSWAAFDPSLRSNLIESHFHTQGITDSKLLSTFSQLPRELFVPSKFIPYAYESFHIPIGFGRCSFSPLLVALMTDAAELRPTDRVLDISTGCGYPAAICSSLCHQVFTMEEDEDLYDEASDRIHSLGLNNVAILYGKNTYGFPKFGPFDVIFLRDIEDSSNLSYLLDQLALLGRMLFVRSREEDGKEELVRITRLSSSAYIEESIAELPSMVPPFFNGAATSLLEEKEEV